MSNFANGFLEFQIVNTTSLLELFETRNTLAFIQSSVCRRQFHFLFCIGFLRDFITVSCTEITKAGTFPPMGASNFANVELRECISGISNLSSVELRECRTSRETTVVASGGNA